MKKTTEIHSCAKVNLGLWVTGRRSDGYHLLRSVFQTVDWWDRLGIETRPGRGSLELSGDNPLVPWDERNLLHKTYRLLQERFGGLDSLRLTVEKTIPPGAGLGGGSGNAAAFLLYLIRRHELDVEEGELNRLAQSLGADLPFFLHGGTALVEGIGEQVRPLDDLKMAPFLALTPDIEVSTARVFSQFSLTNEAPDSTIKTFLRTADPSCLVNQLMPVTCRLYPGIRTAEEEMRRAGCQVVLMSGSGSTLLGFTVDPAAGEVDTARLERRYRQVRWCCGIRRSEYLDRIGA